MKRLVKCISALIGLGLALSAFANDDSDTMIYTEEKTNILVTADDAEFVIKLKSNPTTGYSWFLSKYDTLYLEPVKHRFQSADNKKLIGAPGYEVWTFKAKPAAFTVPIQTSLHFNYARPWEKNKINSDLVFSVSTAAEKS